MNWFDTWIATAPLPVVGGALLLAMISAAAVGMLLRRRQHRAEAEPSDRSDTQEGYITSSIFGLMALLLGFTFSLAVDRFDTRRGRVLESANAIETTYLRAQLLEEPHRTRVSNLLIAYTDNAILLAAAKPDAEGQALLARHDQLLTDLWAGSAAAFDSVRTIDFSSAFLDSMNTLLDADAARRAARQARVPATVFQVLFVYLVVSAGALGFVLTGRGGRRAAIFLLSLMTLALLLILDIDRPILGTVRESQNAIIAVRKGMAERPPAAFDRWRTTAVAAAAAPAPAPR